MTLIDNILKYETVAIAGLAKNTGKTECINYLIKQLSGSGAMVAITSIGMDGECTDQKKKKKKPTITLPRGMIFATSEKHFRERNLDAEILDVSNWHTATGRMVIARVMNRGQIILSGPSQTARMHELNIRFKTKYHCNMVLIDGALSRMSQASPMIAGAMILCTGASLSASMQQVVKQTAHACRLITLDVTDKISFDKAKNLSRGIWKIDPTKEPQLINEETNDVSKAIFQNEPNGVYYVSGACTNKLLKKILQTADSPLELIATDYTKLFVSSDTLHLFKDKGHILKVIRHNELIAVCINPWSPQNYHFDALQFETAMQRAVQIPVYNIRNL